MALEVDILDHIGDLLSTGDIKNLKALMAEEKFGNFLEERANDVIPLAAYYLTKEAMEDNPRVFKYSKKVLEVCAEKGNPKECLMEFLAQIETLDEIKFETMLKPIQSTLLRIPERKGPVMQWVFNIVYSFINSLTIPEYHHVDDNSRLLLDCDDNTQKIRNIYLLLIDFYEPFLNELSDRPLDKRIRGIKLVLLQSLFHLLGKPLVFLDLEYNEKGSSVFRVIASDIVKFILRIQVNPIQFLDLVEDKQLISLEEEAKLIRECSYNEIKFSKLSLSVFFFLIFNERMCTLYPLVYDKLFILHNSLTLAVNLLRYEETMVHRKGLLLTKTSVEKVEPGTVGFSCLSSNVHKEIIGLLSNIAVHNDVEEHRKLAVELIKQHVFAFEPKAQFYILLNISSEIKHVQLIGFFVTILTRLMREVFNNSELYCYFTGKRLHDLLKIFCSLKDGAETDLMENKDQILPAINLIIFLTLRDKQNITGIWDFADNLIKSFLSPLREGIDLSRAHYKLQLDSLDDPLKTENGAELAVTVGGKLLNKISREEKIEVINSGLTVFDLIEHLLSRADECILNKPCN